MRRLRIIHSTCKVLSGIMIMSISAAGQTTTPLPGGHGLPASLSVPAVQTDVMPNGLKVYHVRVDDLPLVEIGLVIRSGSDREDVSQAGIASITREALLHSVPNRSLESISADLSNDGSSLTALMNFDYTFFSVKSLSRNLLKSAEVLSTLCINANITKEAIDQAMAIARPQVSRYQPNQAEQATMGFLTSLFGKEHNLARNQFGTLQTLEAITVKDVQDWYLKWYRPDNAALLVVGNVDYSAIRSVLLDRFGGWKAASTPMPPVEHIPVAQHTAVVVNDTGAVFCQIRIGFAAPRRGDQSIPSVMLANQVLGGGVNALLGASFWVNRHISPNFFSTFSSFRDQGYLVISGSAPTYMLDSVLTFIAGNMDMVRAGTFSQENLEDAKFQLLGNIMNEFTTNSKMIVKLRDIAAYELPVDAYSRTYESILAAKISTAASFAQAGLDLSKAVIAVYGNEEKITPVLKKHFGSNLEVHVRPAAEPIQQR